MRYQRARSRNHLLQALEAAGIDPEARRSLERKARRRLENARARNRALVAQHPGILKREPWREKLYRGGRGAGHSWDAPRGPSPMTDGGHSAKGSVSRAGGRSLESYEGVELSRKKPDEESKHGKPVNPHLYNSLKNRAERRGAIIRRGDSETVHHLDIMGAGAGNMGDMLFFRENPTTSDVLEEFFHLEQHYRGDYSECDCREQHIRREIDAKRYLLSVAERYNIPQEETDVTLEQLRGYEDELREFERKKSS